MRDEPPMRDGEEGVHGGGESPVAETGAFAGGFSGFRFRRFRDRFPTTSTVVQPSAATRRQVCAGEVPVWLKLS